MQKRAKFLAYILSAAMVVTSFPANLTTTASAAQKGVVTSDSGSRKGEEEPVTAATWKKRGSYVTDAVVTGTSVTVTEEFSEVSTSLESSYTVPDEVNNVSNIVLVQRILNC